MSFAHWEAYLSKARDGYSRPVQNNTRVHWCGEDAICIELHSTNIVTFHRDGRIALAANGWYTVTTAQRIKSYSPARLCGWKLPFEHDPHDPEPNAPLYREILRPFHASDPGPEPVDDGVGCRVGEVEEYEVQEDQVTYGWQSEKLDEARGFPVPGSDWNREQGHVTRRITRMHVTEIVGAGSGGYYRDWQAEEAIRKRGHEPKKCAHCEAFAERHEAWHVKMNGPRYSRRESGAHGYRQMCEALEQFGTREAWQEAYIEELRNCRANKRAHKEWEQRNFCDFHDGIEVLPSGSVPLKAKRIHVKRLREAARLARKRKREEDERAARRARHEQALAEQKRVKRMVAEALAQDIFVGIEGFRPEWQKIKHRHHGQEVAA